MPKSTDKGQGMLNPSNVTKAVLTSCLESLLKARMVTSIGPQDKATEQLQSCLKGTGTASTRILQVQNLWLVKTAGPKSVGKEAGPVLLYHLNAEYQNCELWFNSLKQNGSRENNA